MYLNHFGLNEPPFRITPHTDFFFEGANRGATLEALLYAIVHDEGIVKVSGEVGSGKTMLCRVLLERLPKNVDTIYLANPSLARDEILTAIAEDLRVDVTGKRTTLLLRALQEHLIERYSQGGRVVVLIDEAHAMPPETLEEIRLLSNLESNRHKLLQIVLFGQPELDEHLNSPSMRQLKERITHSFRLEPLVRSDIESYVDFRMRAAGYRGRNAFSTAALRIVARASEGLTRRINILCDKALLAAFADGSHEVTAKHARAAVKDSGFSRLPRRLAPLWVAAGCLALGLVVGLGLHYLLPSDAPNATTSSKRSAAPPERPGGPAAPVTAGVSATVKDSYVPASVPAPPVFATAGRNASSSGVDAAPEERDRRNGPDSGVEDRRPESMSGRLGAAASDRGLALADDAPDLSQAPLLRERLLATRAQFERTPADRYSIQLLTAKESELSWVENFLRRASALVGEDELYVYSRQSNSRAVYRVTFGIYGSLQESSAAIAKLPVALRAYKPFPETLAAMKETGGPPVAGSALAAARR